MTIHIILLLCLIIFSGFFSGTETAYTSLSLIQVETLSKTRGKRGKLVEKLKESSDILITTILIGNNLVNIAASAIATQLTIQLFGNSAIGIMTGIMTLIILIFGEVTPKRLAIVHNEFICIHTARFIYILSKVFFPFIWFITRVSSFFTYIFGGTRSQTLTLENIFNIVNLAENLGIIEHYKNRMVKRVLRFSDVTVHAIMTHRTNVYLLDKENKIEDVIDEINTYGFSRIPVYEDNPEHIVGIVLIKDILNQITAGKSGTTLKKIMRTPIFVPQNKKIYEMFMQFKQQKMNIAVVLDEYGGLSGIVTMEDVIEEILGEIYDEHERKGREQITKLSNNTYLIMGDTPIYIVNDMFDLEIPQRKNMRTLAGFLVDRVGEIPTQKEKIETEYGEFVIEHLENKRIISVRFSPPEGITS